MSMDLFRDGIKGHGPIARHVPCGTLLQSQHRHDWTACACWDGEGKGVFLDGGADYLRMGGDHRSLQWFTKRGTWEGEPEVRRHRK